MGLCSPDVAWRPDFTCWERDYIQRGGEGCEQSSLNPRNKDIFMEEKIKHILGKLWYLRQDCAVTHKHKIDAKDQKCYHFMDAEKQSKYCNFCLTCA